MRMATETEVILGKLDSIRDELNYIREHIGDIDVVLTDDDVNALQEAERDLKEGRTRRL